MATSWKSQQGNGEYSLQFETDNKEKYKLVEKAAQMAMDGKTISDIAEVKYGEWGKPIRTTEGWIRECSVCLYCSNTGAREFKPLFCSNCGAKMDGGVRRMMDLEWMPCVACKNINGVWIEDFHSICQAGHCYLCCIQRGGDCEDFEAVDNAVLQERLETDFEPELY